MEELLRARGLRFDIEWRRGGLPFLTAGGALLEAVTEAVRAETGQSPALSTGGGTSDGRFVAPTGSEVVELGVVNRSIHQIDEHVDAASVEALSRMYEAVLRRLLGPSAGA